MRQEEDRHALATSGRPAAVRPVGSSRPAHRDSGPRAHDHRRAPYAEALQAYADRDWLRLGVPGHQAHTQSVPGVRSGLADLLGDRALALDVSVLIEGIDLRTGGQGPAPLDQARALAADAWGARRAWFLTNGASKGNLVTCLALRGMGRDMVVQRSVHSSVVDGMALAGLRGHFVQPSLDPELGMAHGVSPRDLDRRLREHPEAIAAYVVTPSYFGAVADVAGLSSVAHAHGVPLVVDEAWGAHFGFHPRLPVNAARLGADVVVSSTHKLAGSLTQSALLLLGEGPYADRLAPLLDRAFRSMQSTSASALLMASLDLARRDLVVHGRRRLKASVAAAEEVRARVAAAGRFADPGPRMLSHPDVLRLDPLRIVVDTRSGGIGGHEARHRLFDEHGVHLEMSTDAVVVAVVGAGTVPDVGRLVTALHALPTRDLAATPVLALPPAGPRAMGVRRAYVSDTEVVGADAAVGRVSADSLAAYPPGIPNLLPGEVVTAEVLDFLRATAASPYGYVRGALDPAVSTLRVVR